MDKAESAKPFFGDLSPPDNPEYQSMRSNPLEHYKLIQGSLVRWEPTISLK